jgi:site-specific recombinase XerD
MFRESDETMLLNFEESLTRLALSPATIVNYLADLRVFLRWGKQTTGAAFALNAVGQDDIRLYRYHLVKELNRATATVNRHLMALRKFYAWARETGRLEADPSAGVSLVHEEGQAIAPPLTTAEAERLLTAAEKGTRVGLARRDLAILHLLLYTGLRVSEIVNLNRADVVFDHPGVHLKICHNLADGEKTRQLPLSGQICKVLNDYLAVRPPTLTYPHLFLSQDGRPLSPRTVQRIISDCARTAGLSGVSAQGLRRTFALQLYAETHDIELISERLGHQSKAITEQYLKLEMTS